jgi:hypothetical protein
VIEISNLIEREEYRTLRERERIGREKENKIKVTEK